MTSDIESIVGSKLYLQSLHRHDKQTQETFNSLVKKVIAYVDAIAAQRCKKTWRFGSLDIFAKS